MHTVVERNFYSGTDSSRPFSIGQHSVISLPHPPTIVDLINGVLVAVGISHRLQHLDKLVASAVRAYDQKEIQDYFFIVEAMLLSMRRVIDDLVMSIYCMTHEYEIEQSRKLAVDGYGSLWRSGKPTDFGRTFVSQYLHPNEEIAEIIVELSNSFKHSYLLSESRAWGRDFPTVLALHGPRNDYSGKVTLHNHSLGQIVIGFNVLVSGIVERSNASAKDA
jgi:hypothetical protein